MVVGGDDYPGDPGKSVEIFDIELNIWREGPQLPEHLDGSPGVAEVENVVYVVGGYGEEGISSNIFSLEKGAADWKVQQNPLKDPRGFFPFFSVPFNISDCL